MKGKLPDAIVDRPKQAYRAPISSTFVDNKPTYLEEILSPEKIKEAGIFNPESTSLLLNKIISGQPFSEMDNMALTGVISTQLIHDLFINNKKKTPQEQPKNCTIITDDK